MSTKLPERQDTVNVGYPTETGGDGDASGEAFTALVVQVLRLNGLLVAAGDSLAKPSGQTSARWKVLAAIEDGPSTVAEIARVFGLARQSVQRIADLLVEDGLAIYEGNPRHRRAKLLKPTPQGLQAVRAIQSAQRRWARALGAEIGEDALKRSSAVLADVIRGLEGAGARSLRADLGGKRRSTSVGD